MFKTLLDWYLLTFYADGSFLIIINQYYCMVKAVINNDIPN